MKIPTSRSELQKMGATMIAEASSDDGDRSIWTELSLWWVDDPNRPFIPVVERCVDAESTTEVAAFKAQCFGSSSRAMAWFEASNLRDTLVTRLPADMDDTYPDANELRRRTAAANRGYQGEEDVASVLRWLYGEGEFLEARAAQFEQDFGVPLKHVLLQADVRPGSRWLPAFFKAMRFFDKQRWERENKS